MSAELALQGILVRLWKADAGVGALVGDRIYDQAPANAAFPYVRIDTMQSIDLDVGCGPQFEIYVDVHTWSRATGFPETYRIITALRDALRTAFATGTLPTDAGATVFHIDHETTRTLRDPDGRTTHGVMTLRAFMSED
ncbi:DUF3168 domain-containing protein [Acuticoccus sediminis]|uniref:DUF3168 domain-containing protein n=1 Tax=Acuticoccus sediminis TaxID=2184697 RepID=UPI001CFDECC0|nr:DUF3168 domain-containing protein [Acuticoccus sediminis]